MRILALITARSGSKRVLGKNIRLLGSKSLVVWSIDIAKNIFGICDILVSTDDSKIAKISSSAGAYVPWLRPPVLSTDSATSVDVALHALDWYESEKGKVDGLLLLQPTSPFRTKNTMRKGIKLFIENDFNTVLGVSAAQEHPMWMMGIEKGELVPFSNPHGFGVRSQDLPPAFLVNGSFYLISPTELRKSSSFVSGKLIPLLIESPQESLDIDTEWDFSIAELISNNMEDVVS